jgi:hypothetical protein
MTLDDLLFRAEDFDLGLEAAGEGKLLIQTVTEVKWAHKLIAEQANRLLRERLEKAPQVFMVKGFGHFDTWREEGDPTHKARLVCIEEIK